VSGSARKSAEAKNPSRRAGGSDMSEKSAFVPKSGLDESKFAKC
jgi:hypothetical protein